MKILILCDEGNNRSVVLKSRLQYCGDGHDILTAGLNRNSYETIRNLISWADLVILTDSDQAAWWEEYVPNFFIPKMEVWNIGPDIYPRPHNKELLKIVTKLIEDHPELSIKST